MTNTEQYQRRRQLEVSNVPVTIPQKELKTTIARMLSLTGTDIQPGHLDKCHRLHKESTVIIEFKERTPRESVLRGRKNYKNQIKNLANLGLQKSFVTESLCTEMY